MLISFWGILVLSCEGCVSLSETFGGRILEKRPWNNFSFLITKYKRSYFRIFSSANTLTSTSLHNQVDPEPTPLYYDSTHYKELCKYFTQYQQKIDQNKFNTAKNRFVRQRSDVQRFIPASFDLESLSAVPELFHENFLYRGEDHWDTLMKIRDLYLGILELYERKKELISRRYGVTKSYKTLPEQEQAAIREDSLKLRDNLRDLRDRINRASVSLKELQQKLPNILSEEVPLTNIIEEEFVPKEIQTSESRLEHYRILDRLNGDFVGKAVEISGTGFSALSGNICRLERALANFMLDTHCKLFGYTEISVPLIVSESTLGSTGHLPRFEEDLFKLDQRHHSNRDSAYLIPTAEVPLLGLFKNSRLDQKDLPIWLCSYSPCFRSEIQDYGRDTRGIIRQHQFGKVELICLSNSVDSEYFHGLMISHIEYILKLLELPYRKVLLSGKDTGSLSSKTIDFEAYFPASDKFVEVSSCSNTRDFQSTRLNIFTKSRNKIHCINGSGLAIGRTLSAILENFHSLREDNGTIEIKVPKVLRPYIDDMIITEPLPENVI